MNAIPSAVLAAATTQKQPAIDQDRLAALREHAAHARDLEQIKANLEERLHNTNKALNELYFRTMPDLMEEAGVSSLTLPADGNSPAVELKAQPYYRANIAADWPEDRRQEAFDWLTNNGHGDLIKTEVAVRFNRGELEQAQEFSESARQQGLDPALKQTVPHTTLSAWLKEMIERHSTIPPLDTLGATVGRVVRLKTKEQ